VFVGVCFFWKGRISDRIRKGFFYTMVEMGVPGDQERRWEAFAAIKNSGKHD